VSDTWEVVGNTLYLRKPAPSAPAKEHVDWIAFPGYAEAARRICAERNKAVAALEADLAAEIHTRQAAQSRVIALETRLADLTRLHAEAIRGCNDGTVILAAERRQADEQAELERARADRAEARLAEVAPVVEAAEALRAHVDSPDRRTFSDFDTETELLKRVYMTARALRAARAKREGGS